MESTEKTKERKERWMVRKEGRRVSEGDREWFIGIQMGRKGGIGV